MAAFSGQAFADIQLPLSVLDINNNVKALSTQLGTGYATKYISRGLAFQNSGSDNTIPLEIVSSYKMNSKYSLFAGLKYQWLTDNGLDHDKSGICDEGTGILGVSRKFGNPQQQRSAINSCTAVSPEHLTYTVRAPPISQLSTIHIRKNTASFWTFTMTSAKGWKTSSGTAAYNIRSAG